MKPFFYGVFMSKDAFSDQYKHPKWQKKRLEMLDAASFQCSNCGEQDSQLHVHHKTYIKGRKIWDYKPSQLAVLCEKCHASEHAAKDVFNEILSTQSYALSAAMLAGFTQTELIGNDVHKKCQVLDAHTYAAAFIAYLIKDNLTLKEMYQLGQMIVETYQADSEELARFQKHAPDIFGV